MAPMIKLLRPHQWTKNTLLFVPIFTATLTGDAGAWMHTLLAAMSFCLLASAGYVFNDLNDIEKDRLHPSKSKRPLAAGTVSRPGAIAAATALTVLGLITAALVNRHTLALASLYLVATFCYTRFLKTYVLADVLSLAGLYTLRIVAGAAAIGQPCSLWLLSFSMFLFFSLALIKRYGEIDPALNFERGKFGRDYALGDIPVVISLGVSSGLLAVMVMGLYVDSRVAMSRYASPHWMWLVCPIIWYWCARLWFKAVRREIDDDPVISAMKDKVSWICLMVIAALYAAATAGIPDPFG